TLGRLMLMTATLDEKERERYERYFTSNNLKFAVLDYSDTLCRNKHLTMSCYTGTPMPDKFTTTELSQRVSAGSWRKDLAECPHPNTQHLLARVRAALEQAVQAAWLNLQARLDTRRKQNTLNRGCTDASPQGCNMQSIIVILPGLDQVDRMYSGVFQMKGFTNKGLYGFHPVRLTSLVKDDESITSECDKRGDWQPRGNKGRIVFTTNLVANGLTVPNAAYVIDSGQLKLRSPYTRNGLSNMKAVWIDKNMLIQRAGRTGRTNDGEYLLPFSAGKVEEMLQSSHHELLLNRYFDERHFFYSTIYDL
ncbi:hypothetical protein PFISCL1PPCAC_22329, partial [Pristionchus fissidentatus]